MSDLSPINVVVELNPLKTQVELNPLVNQVQVNPDKTSITVTGVGVQGAAGGMSIGGKPVNVVNVQAFDVLQFNTNDEWSNSPQTNITDGGNF